MIDNGDFANGLNLHGYALQHRVVHDVTALANSNASRWSVLGIEMPVVAGDLSTRIDIVLTCPVEGGNQRYMVVECKRTNPAFGAWCFTRSNRAFPAWLHKQVCGEFIVHDPIGSGAFRAGGFGMRAAPRICDVAFALATNAKGDAQPISNDRDGLERACVGAIVSMNGFVDLLLGDIRVRERLASIQAIWLLPVVVTTAKLYTAEVDFGNVDIETGMGSAANVLEVPWVVYQYPTSPQYKHSIDRGVLGDDPLEVIVARDYWRSVAVVNAACLGDFLRCNLLDHFVDDHSASD